MIEALLYRGTSLMRNRLNPGPFSRDMPRPLWWTLGGGRFIMIKALLHACRGLLDTNMAHPKGVYPKDTCHVYSTLAPLHPRSRNVLWSTPRFPLARSRYVHAQGSAHGGAIAAVRPCSSEARKTQKASNHLGPTPSPPVLAASARSVRCSQHRL